MLSVCPWFLNLYPQPRPLKSRLLYPSTYLMSLLIYLINISKSSPKLNSRSFLPKPVLPIVFSISSWLQLYPFGCSSQKLLIHLWLYIYLLTGIPVLIYAHTSHPFHEEVLFSLSYFPNPLLLYILEYYIVKKIPISLNFKRNYRYCNGSIKVYRLLLLCGKNCLFHCFIVNLSLRFMELFVFFFLSFFLKSFKITPV